MLPDDIKNLNLWPKYRQLIKDQFHLDRRIRRCHVQKNICNDETSPCPRLVLLYARMGLHPYNFLEKKKFQLSSVKEYNMSTGSAAASYDITLEANDLSLQTFETSVSESSFGKFVLTCQIARPLGETIDVGKGTGWVRNDFLEDSIPGWPSENPFENSNRSYVLNESELQDKDNDWIRLYLELAVATTNRGTIRTHDLSNLKIVKVAIDYTPQDVDLEFNRKHVAIVYIRYKDSCEARVGKDVYRVAIVRRAFTEQLVNFTLVGQTLSLESIPEKGKKQRQQLPVSLSLKRRLLSSPKRLLSSPKRLKAYKYSRVGLSRRLHKTISTFEGREWNDSRKSCSGQMQPLGGSSYPSGQPPSAGVVSKVLSSMKKPVFLPDITTSSQLRKDAHPSSYGGDGGTDCSHWCLPGLPDTWNQLLYAALSMCSVNNLYKESASNNTFIL